MKFLNFDNVLCLSPHPDDTEYSMSATIKKYKDTHFNILCMSHGGEDDPTSGDHRFDEVKAFWESMGCNSNVTLSFESGFISRYKESKWINLIETEYLEGVQCIMLTSKEDAHFEHRIVNSVANPLSRTSPLSIIEYKSPSTTGMWIPNLFVNVSDTVATLQYDSLNSAFITQNDAPYFSRTSLDAFHTDFASIKRGMGLVEMFKIVQIFK